jgi:L-alanine-DL-glutamate epimerase-like enolase superfamily enzyme
MKVRSIETRHCDAGWRNYHFVKLTTEDGLVGWSEYDEHQGAAGVTSVVQRLTPFVAGERVQDTERVFAKLQARARQSMSGVMAMGIGALENALLDAKAKLLGVPCCELLGGKIRDRIRVYWSHCGTWRIAHPGLHRTTVTGLDGIRALGAEVRESGFTALKTNIFDYRGETVTGWAPGFGHPFQPDQNVERHVIRQLRAHLEAFRDGAGPDLDILVDLNYNAKPEGYLRILRSLADLDVFWFEIDTPHPEALADVRRGSPHTISSCESLITPTAFLPYFRLQAMDVAIIDAVWNGVWQSMKIAAIADAHQINVAPHNYYGHLATMMSAHLCAAVPNLRIMETDVDRGPWDDQLFTVAPDIRQGHLHLPDTPGWGTEPDEAALARHPPKAH